MASRMTTLDFMQHVEGALSYMPTLSDDNLFSAYMSLQAVFSREDPLTAGEPIMAEQPNDIAIDTQHDDMVHDAQLDYYGRKLATASSDRTVKVFEVGPEGRPTLLTTLAVHEGPVWQVAWAHPRYGAIVASASYDGSVTVHKENNGQWIMIQKFTNPQRQSFNSVSWGPWEYGLILAAACADGHVYVYQHTPDDSWKEEIRLHTSQLGVNAVSWAPATDDGAWRLAAGSCDNLVTIWQGSGDKAAEEWTPTQLKEDGHKDWVRDVAWAPLTGLPNDVIASACEDGQVLIWTQDGRGGNWSKKELPPLPGDKGPAWRVSWSVTGNVLAVSSGAQTVSLWKQELTGEWALWQQSVDGELKVAA